MSRVNVIEYNNKKIIYVNGKDASRQECIEGIKEYFEVLKTFQPGTALVLFDMTNAEGSKDFLKIFKENVHLSEKFVKKTADVGVTGVKKMFFNSYIAFTMMRRKNIGYKLTLKDTIEEAKKWLTEE